MVTKVQKVTPQERVGAAQSRTDRGRRGGDVGSQSESNYALSSTRGCAYATRTVDGSSHASCMGDPDSQCRAQECVAESFVRVQRLLREEMVSVSVQSFQRRACFSCDFLCGPPPSKTVRYPHRFMCVLFPNEWVPNGIGVARRQRGLERHTTRTLISVLIDKQAASSWEANRKQQWKSAVTVALLTPNDPFIF